jgi:hypothetical protein
MALIADVLGRRVCLQMQMARRQTNSELKAETDS